MRLLTAIVLLSSLSIAAWAAPVKENIGLYGGRVADIEAIDNAGTSEILIAVDTSQRGIFRWNPTSTPPKWESVTNPSDASVSGKIPGQGSLVEEDVTNAGIVYGVLSFNAASRFRALYVSSNYGDLSGTSVSWTPALDSAGAALDEVTSLHGHSSGMYAGTNEGEIYRNTGGSAGTFALVYSNASSDPVIDFTVVSATKGYVVTRSVSGSLNLWATDWGATNSSLTSSLPTAAPVELRTGACPINDCSLEIDLIGADPIDSAGDTIYIAGSSTNGMAFKSIDGGTTWNQGWDYQCGRPSSGCTNYGFTDGYPQGDTIRFRGTATSGTESKNVFISKVVIDLDESLPSWSKATNLSSTIYPSGPTGPSIVMSSNVNDGALAIDPNDNTQLYIASDLAIGKITHDPASGFANPAGEEMGNANGIEGLVINDLDFFENSATDKELWITTKSGSGFATGYDPSDPSSVADASGWVFPIYVGGDGAPSRTVAIDPSDKTLALIGTSSVYRNDRATTLPDVATNWDRVFDPQDTAFSGSGQPLESDRVERSYTTALEWQTSAAGSCDRVYLSVANTDTGLEGGIFYSDDKGLNWRVDTLNSGSSLLKMPVNALLSNDNFLWAAVGDRDGRSSETGIRARVSLCSSSAWWKPTHSTDTVFATLQAEHITALAGTTSSSTYDGVVYVTSEQTVYKGELLNSASCTTSGFDCWQFSNITPSASHSGFSAVAVEPSDADHVWVAYDNCIQESTNGGATWAVFGGSCTDDHETIRVLVYDDLISGTNSGAFAYVDDGKAAASCESEGFSWDIDHNSEVNALGDGLLAIRHLFGFTDDALVNGAIEASSQRSAPTEITSYLASHPAAMDIDGDGAQKPLTDGLLAIRYFFGFTDDALITNAIASSATRKTSDAIVTCIEAND